jgi:ribonucleotide monophosphatase NagD (HAD superfamily)
MICANPDTVYRRGDRLVWCAGALADIYETFGGSVVRLGKPSPRIYAMAREHLGAATRLSPHRVLAIGDGPATDITGAARGGMDSLFIGSGIHRLGECEAFLAQAIAVLDKHRVRGTYASPALRW